MIPALLSIVVGLFQAIVELIKSLEETCEETGCSNDVADKIEKDIVMKIVNEIWKLISTVAGDLITKERFIGIAETLFNIAMEFLRLIGFFRQTRGEDEIAE